MGGPGLAAVAAAVDLAAIGGAGHVGRPTLVEGQREHRVRRLQPHIDAGPAVAAVGALQQHADIALEAGTRRDPELARIARDLADVAAIDLPLWVHRLERHGPPVVAAIGAVEHAGPADRIDRVRPPAAGQHAVHVDGVVVDVLAVAQIFPMLAAIGRAQGAADLDRGVEQLGLGGAGVHLQHPLCRVRARSRGDLREAHADRQPGPMLAGIVAAVDLAILVADEDHVGIVRVKQHRPHRQAVIGQLDLLPVLAVIGAAVGAGLRAGIDDLRLQRMHRQRAHRRRFGQAALQKLPFVAAVGEAAKTGMHRPPRSGFARQTEIEDKTLDCSVRRMPSIALPLRNKDRRGDGGAARIHRLLHHAPRTVGTLARRLTRPRARPVPRRSTARPSGAFACGWRPRRCRPDPLRRTRRGEPAAPRP